MYLIRTLIVFFVMATSAHAQTLDPAFLQRAIAAVQTQRNLALDTAAVAEAKVAALSDDLAKANLRIRELEAKAEEKK